jgi:2-dehydro-3-deoxyphosphogluconate aldolase/(4S)-4-hydroxy-2-oxoglutarate aldolase
MNRSPEYIISQIENTKVIPIYNHDDLDECKRVIRDTYKKGLRVFEFTNRSANALKVFSELVPFVEGELSEMSLGVGTILSLPQAEAFVKAGAHFLVSPVLDLEILEYCSLQRSLYVPGCFTPTEIAQAYKAGASIVKLFPASVLTPSFIKNIKSPMPFAKIIATGGIKTNEIQGWLDAGAAAVGMGSALFESANP